jgi:hypothetical protein
MVTLEAVLLLLPTSRLISEEVKVIIVVAGIVSGIIVGARRRGHSSSYWARQRSSEAAANRPDAAYAFGDFAVEFLHAANVFVSMIFNEAFRDALRVGADFLPADERRHLYWRWRRHRI